MDVAFATLHDSMLDNVNVAYDPATIFCDISESFLDDIYGFALLS
jgi:hypothetical protein